MIMDKQGRVLIVHMDHDQPCIWSQAFSEFGYDTFYTFDLDMALRNLLPGKFDLVIFGLLLPKSALLPTDEYFTECGCHAGFQAAKWVRLMYPKMPILIITRGCNDKARGWCLENPPAMFLPFRGANGRSVRRALLKVRLESLSEIISN